MKTLYDTILTLVRGGIDLTPRQIHLLFTLDTPEAKVANQALGELADMAHLSRPLVSRYIERLVDGAYVMRSRDAVDHRRVHVMLTQAGTTFLTAMRKGGMRGFAAKLSTRKDDLTLRQLFTVLACATEPRTIRWLASEMDIVKPAVTRAVDKLEIADYVRRQEDGNDRRSVLVAIRPKGRKFVELTTT